MKLFSKWGFQVNPELRLHSNPQKMIDHFASATNDFQWIHVDVERAKSGPFGGPIAHGYLTLSLGPMLYPTVVRIEGFSMGVNYGANKVRFPSPVPVGSKVRLGVKVLEVEEIANGVQMTMEFTFECKVRASHRALPKSSSAHTSEPYCYLKFAITFLANNSIVCVEG